MDSHGEVRFTPWLRPGRKMGVTVGEPCFCVQSHQMTDKFIQFASIAAILIGPIAALMIQRKLDHLRDKEKRKLILFQNLLTSRSTPLSLQHVQALNLIEIEFYPRHGKNKRVIDSWRLYSDHLNITQPTDPAGSQTWEGRRQELMVDLIYEMSQCLGYDFEKVLIKRDSYYPKGLGNMETELNALRQAALKVFQGENALQIRTDSPIS